MAAVTKVNPSLVTPVGESRIRRGEAKAAIAKGQAVALDGVPSSSRFEAAYNLAADATTAIGIALNDVAVGGVVEVVIDGEVGGYDGLTPGAYLTVVAGELDTTAGTSRFLAYNATTVMLI